MKKSFLKAGTPIQGVVFKPIIEHEDHRGSFSEIFQSYWDSCLDPVQWSMVKSEQGVFRGLHLHLRHDEYFYLVSGHCLVGLKDMRPDSATYLVSSLYELHESDPAALIFPRGLLHGWYFYTKSIHAQGVSESYVDYGKDDNWGCRWNDPELGIDWGVNDVILSDRAANFPDLKQLTSALVTA